MKGAKFILKCDLFPLKLQCAHLHYHECEYKEQINMCVPVPFKK